MRVRAPSLLGTFLFWWVLLFLIQQAQRLLLTALAAGREAPSARTLVTTLFTGVRADLITAGFGMALVLAITLVAGSLVLLGRRLAGRELHPRRTYERALTITSIVFAVVFFVVLTVDMGYYRYSGQRLDFVFFEYIGDLLDATGGTTAETQAGRQTAAEAGEVSKWIAPLAGYLALEIGIILRGHGCCSEVARWSRDAKIWKRNSLVRKRRGAARRRLCAANSSHPDPASQSRRQKKSRTLASNHLEPCGYFDGRLNAHILCRAAIQ